MTVTPAMASKWLETAEKQISDGEFYQRPMSMRHARKLADQMALGFWAVTHQGIAFNEKGHLIDGRHRLCAIVLSGVSIKILVTTGMPEIAEGGFKTFDGIDQIKSRNVGHILQSHGYHSANFMAAVANSLVSLCSLTDAHKSGVSAGQAIQIHDLIKREFVLITEIIPKTAETRASFFSPIIAFARVNRDLAIDFAEKFARLENIPRGHPVLALKAWDKRNRGVGSGTQQKLSIIRAVSTALQHTASGTQVQLIRESKSAQEWLQGLDKAFTRKVLAIANPKYTVIPKEELKLAA